MIFIHGAVPSSKNSKQIVRSGRFTRVIWSERALAYVRESEQEWIRYRETFDRLKTTPPYKVGFHFVRGTKHKYDFVNPLQTVQDLMVRYGWIEDDNMDILIPFPLEIEGKYSSYSKERPGVYIHLLN